MPKKASQLPGDNKAEASLFASILESCTEYAIIGLDLDLNIISWNEGAHRLFGYESTEIIGKDSLANIHNLKDIESGKIQEIIELVQQSGEWSGELECVRRDGISIPVLYTLTTRTNASKIPLGYVLIVHDQTELRNKLQAIRKSEEYTRSLIESNIDILITTDTFGIINDVNRQMCEMTELSRDKLIGSPFKMHFTDPTLAEDLIRKVLSKNRITNYELITKSRNDKLTQVSFNATTFHTTDGRLKGIFATARDITEQKRLESQSRKQSSALLEANNFLSDILKSSISYSIIVLDLEGNILIWNEGAKRNYGYTAEEIIGKQTLWLLHTPEDIKSGRAQAMLDEVLETGKYEGVFERVRKNGERFPAYIDTTIRKDAEGKPVGYVIISKDITVQKQQEQALREQLSYNRSLFESSIDVQMATDMLGILTDMNKQMCVITGYSPEELIGTPFKNYFTDSKRAEECIRNVLIDERVSNYELTIKAKDDKETVVSCNATTFKGTDQNLRGIFAVARDITEQKRSALHLEIQYAIAWILAESSTLFVATAKILKIICERFQWDCGTIWAVDQGENVLRCTRVWQVPELQNDVFLKESQNLKCAPGVGMLGQAWKDRKAIWKSDILHEESFLRKTSAAEIGFNTAIAFPIIYEDEVLGVIEFFSRKMIPPNEDSLQWFESIGNQFGLFLKRKHMEKQMLYLAEHDILTGLPNRNLLEQYLNSALITAKESGQKLAVLFLNLDHFKYVNDSMGHETGDILLKEISERFRQCLKPKDTISRLGTDEFVIILPNIKQKNDIIEIIEKLQNQLKNQITLKSKEFFITASFGVSIYPDDGDTVQTLLKIADIAMYAAKEKGRNNFQFSTPEMTAKAENKSVLENNLREALENNEFILHYQPKIDVVTRKVSGVEALIRWKKADTLIMPGSFISAAESSDLIIPITEWVLKTACLQNKLWQTAGLPTITVSANLSVRNLNKELLQYMEKLLNEIDLKPNSFEVELTESVLMANVENNIQILSSLKEMGLKISIDDFGTGYSSLSYLKRFPIDTLKIDRSFVSDIATDSDDAAIVTAIIAMAHSLGFRVIAEGVETEGQLKFLCEHNCDEIQGFYFSRPLSAEEATDFIKNDNLIRPF